MKKSNDHIVFTKNICIVHNLVVGQLWLDNTGEMTFRNINTNDTCTLKFQGRGNGFVISASQRPQETVGSIFDSNKKLRFSIRGMWDEGMTATDQQTHQLIPIFKGNKSEEGNRFQYFLNNFAMQLNHLNWFKLF